MKHRAPVSIVLLASAPAAWTQSNKPQTPSKGLALLEQVSRRYETAKSYRIDAIEESTSINDFEHDWRKTTLAAAEAPNGRYYYEGHSGFGSAVKVSDGSVVWTFHVEEHDYTKKNVPAKPTEETGPIPMSEMTLTQAENLRKNFAELAGQYLSAEQLPDATLTVKGKAVPCHVVRVQSSDMKVAQPNYSFARTFWIDQRNHTVLRTIEHAHTYLYSGTARIPLTTDTKTSYTHVELDPKLPDGLFTFTPPTDAKLVDKFPSPFAGPNMAGQLAPPLKLKSADGKEVSLDSFRGKPVLLDLWATWCPPCVQSLPELAKLYQDTKDKNLVILAIDSNEDAKKGADFLAQKGHHWPNYQQEGKASKAFAGSSIPRTLLIDAQGKVVFDRTGAPGDELRSEIAKLGPEYASLAQKAEPAPCPVAK
jgi:thiol-disulfide isomerase/thioredoxin